MEHDLNVDRKRSARTVQDLVDKDGALKSPINLSISLTKPIDLPSLTWNNFEMLPTKVKLTNMGHTVMLSAKWTGERPYLSGGALQGKHVFSQLHFHWGATDDEGSEHTVDGRAYPLEMHAIYFNVKYKTPEGALQHKDGTAVTCYFYQVVAQDNPKMQVIVEALPWIEESHTAARMKPLEIGSILDQFSEDYFLYWGMVMTPHCGHPILHMICRKTFTLSSRQMETFRTMRNPANTRLVNNFRHINPLDDRAVFHVAPSSVRNTTLLPPL